MQSLVCCPLQVELAYVDWPEGMADVLRDVFPTLGANCPPGDDGVKLDVGHLLFSRLAQLFNKTVPAYSEYLLHRLLLLAHNML
jgi:hypothetical protein